MEGPIKAMRQRRLHRVSIAAAVLMLASCAGSRDDDLKEFVSALETKDTREVEDLKPMAQYPRAVYTAELDGLRDPFSPPTSRREVTQKGDCKRIDHSKEALEDFSLDSMRMVGTLRKEGKLWGIVKDPNGAVHNVKVGNFLGRNNGQVKDITEGQILLSEVIEDGMGECGWIEREASLALNN